MNDLYLIAHLVRGEPTFAIATRDENNEFWIEPSIGHRVYPYWFTLLGPLLADIAGCGPEVPTEDWPDFWGDTLLGSDIHVSKADTKGGSELLERLGLKKDKPPTTPLVRRF